MREFLKFFFNALRGLAGKIETTGKPAPWKT